MKNPLRSLWPFGRKAVQQTAPTEYRFGSRVDFMIQNAIYGSVHITPSMAMELYNRSSVVATAIDTIVKKIEAIDPAMKRGDDFDDSGPALDLLAKPNNFTLYKQFIGEIARHYLLTGDAFFLVLGQSRPLEIYPAHPINVSPEAPLGNGYAERYHVAGTLAQGVYVGEPQAGENRMVYTREDGLWKLYHLKGFSTRPNALRGDSPLESILSEIRQSIAGHKHNEQTLTMGARLSLLFAIKGAIPDDQFNELEKAIIEKYGGAENRGAIGVVNSDEIEVTEFGVNNKDMDYVNLLQMVKSGVYSRYGIPLPLLVASSQTHSNYENSLEALYDDAVVPVAEVLFEALTDFLIPLFGGRPREEMISYNPLSIDTLRMRRLREIKTQADMMMITTNEKRASVPDLDDIDGGDTILGPGTLAPIAGDGVDLVAQQEEDRAAAAEAEQFARDQALAQSQGGQPGGNQE